VRVFERFWAYLKQLGLNNFKNYLEELLNEDSQMLQNQRLSIQCETFNLMILERHLSGWKKPQQS